MDPFSRKTDSAAPRRGHRHRPVHSRRQKRRPRTGRTSATASAGSGRSPVSIPASYTSRIAGEIKNYDPSQYFDRKDLRKFDPFIQFALIAAEEAVRDADLRPWNRGQGAGRRLYRLRHRRHLHHRIQQGNALLEKGPGPVSPFFLPASIANLAAGQVSIRLGFKGPNLANCTACATSTHSIGDSFRIIQRGDADIMIAGGAEAPITPLGIGRLHGHEGHLHPQRRARKSLAGRSTRTATASSSPRARALLVLEELEHAVKRGAPIYAEVVGYGMTGDAYHMTAPDPEADGAYRSMQQRRCRRRYRARGRRLHQRPRHLDPT